MKTFATYVLAFNQDKWIMRNIENSYPHVDKIYVVYNKYSWGYKTRIKNTFDIDTIKNSTYIDKIEIVYSDIDDETDQRNLCLEKAKADGIDYLMVHDADEFYFHKDFEKIKDYVCSNENVDVFFVKMHTFWKSFRNVLVNVDDRIYSGYPQIIVNTHTVEKYDYSRECKDKTKVFKLIPNVTCYHGAYVLSDKEVYDKINTWLHSTDFDTETWYNEKWLNWNENSINLHPIWPWAWKKTAPFLNDLPEVIQDLKVQRYDITPMEYSYKGIHIGQAPDVYYAFNEMIKEFDTIIEMGTDSGGLTYMLYELKRNDAVIYSYEIDSKRIQLHYGITYNNLLLRELDCLSDQGISEISHIITQPNKRTLVLCDGGNKMKEFEVYSKYLKPGDVIMCHDFQESESTFNNYCIVQNWQGTPESFSKHTETVALKYHLYKYKYYDKFLKSFWGSYIKGIDQSYPYKAEAINYLIKTYNLYSYAEIGVYDPANNFDYIIAPHKHSNDIIDKFEYTHRMTSDEFFNNLQYFTYDIIFIDGLHTYEQSYKDLLNAMNSINENGFIILHDINPLSRTSALPNENDSYKYGNYWHGEVYKTLIRFLNEYTETWNVICLDEPTGGLAIITQRNIKGNKPNRVYELTWDEFDNNRDDILNLKTLDEFKYMV